MSNEKKFDPTKPCKLRGRNCPVRIICTDAKGVSPLIGLIEDNPGEEGAGRWFANGRVNSVGESPYDLVNLPEKRYGYLYEHGTVAGEIRAAAQAYPTAEARDAHVRYLRTTYGDGAKIVGLFECEVTDGLK